MLLLSNLLYHLYFVIQTLYGWKGDAWGMAELSNLCNWGYFHEVMEVPGECCTLQTQWAGSLWLL